MPPTFPKVTWNPGNHQIWGFWGASGAARWAQGVRKSSQIVLRTKKWFGSFLEPNFVQILCKINEIRSKSLSEARLGRFEQIGPKSNFWTSRRDFSARWWRLRNPSGRHLIPIPKMTFLDFFCNPTIFSYFPCTKWDEVWDSEVASQPRIPAWSPDFDLDRPCDFEARFLSSMAATAKSVW